MIRTTIAILERLFTWLSSAALFAMMTIVFLDVGFRYLLNAPFSWSHDVITLYLTPMIFFLGLSNSVRHSSHISVDILKRTATPRSQALMEMIGLLLAIMVFFGMFGAGAARTWQSWRANDVLSGAIEWPTWLSIVFVPLGTSILLLRLATLLVDTVRRAFGNSPQLATAEQAGKEEL